MSNFLKFLSFWVVCIIIASFTFIQVNPHHRINVATAVAITIAAPVFAFVCTTEYIIDEFQINWNKCVVGCEGEQK